MTILELNDRFPADANLETAWREGTACSSGSRARGSDQAADLLDSGGGEGSRTPDLCRAKAALYH